MTTFNLVIISMFAASMVYRLLASIEVKAHTMMWLTTFEIIAFAYIARTLM